MPTTSFDRLPNKEAQRHFNQKTLITSQEYANFKAYEHALAFTVAKIADQDMLAEVHKAVKSAIDNGTSFHDFKKRLKPYLMARGWIAPAFKNDNVDDDKETFRDYQKHLGHRLRTIYHTNKATAYAAGRWERIQRTKDMLPYLQYMPSVSANLRDEHKQFYGLIATVDDPIWQSIYPPNDFGCKCWVRQLTKTKAQKLLDEQAKDGVVYDIEMQEVKDPKTGDVISIPKGIAPSFNHNHDRLTALLRLAEDKHGADFADRLGKQAQQILEKTRQNLHTNKNKVPNINLSQALSDWVSDERTLAMYRDDYQSIDKTVYPLSFEEYALIHHYTTGAYEDINAYFNGLKSFDKQRQIVFNTTKDAINTALQSLPVYQGSQVVRMVHLPDEVLAKYQIGKTIQFNALTSTSYGDDVAIQGNENVRFVITHKTGRKIDDISRFSHEQEVLIEAGKWFKVKDYYWNDDKQVLQIELEQVE